MKTIKPMKPKPKNIRNIIFQNNVDRVSEKTRRKINIETRIYSKEIILQSAIIENLIILGIIEQIKDNTQITEVFDLYNNVYRPTRERHHNE